jgi:hypothetical protein
MLLLLSGLDEQVFLARELACKLLIIVIIILSDLWLVLSFCFQDSSSIIIPICLIYHLITERTVKNKLLKLTMVELA